MKPASGRSSFTRGTFVLLALLAPLASQASVVLGPGFGVCPDNQFNACYIGVDGGQAATQTGNDSFSFVGIGVNSDEISGVNFPGGGNPGAHMASGVLQVQVGSTLSVSGPVVASRPYDSSITVGNGAGSTGALNVFGAVSTPLLFIGQTDNRASTGTVLVHAAHLDATYDAVNGVIPGLTSIGIGRGAGSTGTLQIETGSTVNANGASVSMGRLGSGTLLVFGGSTFATTGSIYASAADPAGTSMIDVQGVGSRISVGNGGHLLLGVAVDTATGSQLNQGWLPKSAAHGTATLHVGFGAEVDGSVVIGAGGTVSGTGKIVGNVIDYGTMSPGNSPGTLTIDGDYVKSGGTYLVQVAGTGPGQTDLLDVTGNATLSDATILFSFIDGFAPTAGFTFDFLHAASITASNLTFDFEGLAPGFMFSTDMTGGAFRFTAVNAGLAVPEPDSVLLFVLGLLLLTVVPGRRREA